MRHFMLEDELACTHETLDATAMRDVLDAFAKYDMSDSDSESVEAMCDMDNPLRSPGAAPASSALAVSEKECSKHTF